MIRRFAGVAVAVALVALATPAVGSVEGSWNVQGNLKTRVKIQGFPAQAVREPVADFMTFYPGGAFEMLDAGGTWTQQGKKFIVNVNAADVVALYEQVFADEGLTVDVTITKLRLKGKERSAGIKGKLTMKMTLFIRILGTPGKVKAKYNFRGVPVVTSQGAPGQTGQGVEGLRPAARELARELAAQLAGR